MLDNPLIHKIAATVTAAAVIGLGATSFDLHRSVAKHEVRFEALMEMREDVRAIRDKTATIRLSDMEDLRANQAKLVEGQDALKSDMAAIKTDVAVLQTQTNRVYNTVREAGRR